MIADDCFSQVYQPDISFEETPNEVLMEDLVENQTEKRMNQLTKTIKSIEKLTPDLLICKNDTFNECLKLLHKTQKNLNLLIKQSNISFPEIDVISKKKKADKYKRTFY